MICGLHPGICPHDVMYFLIALPFIGGAFRWVIGCCSRCCSSKHEHHETEVHKEILHGQEDQADRPAI
jgi:hypothetical protein